MNDIEEAAVRLAAILSGQRPWGTPTPSEAAALIGSARHHGLGPVLLWRLRQESVPASGPGWSAVVDQERRVAARYELGVIAQRDIDAALGAVGIPTIWIKGFALAHTVYPDPAVRSMGDLDFMAPYDRREEALAIVEGLGYRNAAPELFDGHQERMHHYHLQGGPADAMHVELHYTWGDPAVMEITDAEVAWFWSERRPYTQGRVSFHGLSPEAHLGLLVLHALAHHGEEEFVLRRYLDMHLLVTAYPALDWARLADKSAAFGWAAVLRRALDTTAQLFGTVLPATVPGLLTRPTTSREAAWLTARPAPDDKLNRALGHVSRMPLGLRLRWALALVFPSRDYLLWRYGVRQRWKAPLLYPWRWLLVTAEVAKTAWRRLRR